MRALHAAISLFYFRKFGEGRPQFLIRRNVVVHYAVIELLICYQVEVSCACEADEYDLLFAGLYALLCFIYCHPDGM